MQTRTGRFVLLALLLVAGVGAALSTWNSARRIVERGRSEQDAADRIDRLLTTVAAVTTAQQASVSSSPDRRAERASALIDRLGRDASSLRPQLRARDATRVVAQVLDGGLALGRIEDRVHEHVRLGQDLMAADVVFSDARATTDGITSALRELRLAESAVLAEMRSAELRSVWTIIGAVAAFWMVGLIVFAGVPVSPAVDASPSTVVSALVTQASGTHGPRSQPRLDLLVAADVCTAMGRLAEATDLPALLTQAASVLDASGIIVWMAAGDELFVAASHGYPSRMTGLGPINRAAMNATAAAWRSGTMQVVTADPPARGALVAPLFSPDRCIGVLAIELSRGREEDLETRAVTTMFAAQLAAALAGWPPSSTAAAPADHRLHRLSGA